MKHLIVPAMLAGIAIVCSCGKNYNSGGNNVQPVGAYTLQSAFASLAVVPKTVTLNATTGGTFSGGSGSRYVFPANSFKKADGSIVTGDVQVTVAEYITKSDMLFSGVLPITATDALMSGGEAFVGVKQGGQDLEMAPGKKYQVNMPQKNPPPPDLQLFEGTKDPVTNGVIWKPATDTSGQVIYNGDTISILSTKVNYANADKFLSAPQYQTFTISLTASGVTLTDSIMAYALYDTYNGVWPMYYISDHVITENHLPNTPIHFVVASVINGSFYGGILGATPTTGSNYTINLTKTTPAAFKAQVDAL